MKENDQKCSSTIILPNKVVPMELLKSLSTAEKKKIRKAVEKELERYRFYKATAFIERETNIISSYDPRYHGPTNVTNDQTAVAAIHNVDELQKRKEFCKRIETAINQISERKRFLITEKYLSKECDYVTDYMIYGFKFDPPISEKTFTVIRNRAMLKLSLLLGIDCGFTINAY